MDFSVFGIVSCHMGGFVLILIRKKVNINEKS